MVSKPSTFHEFGILPDDLQPPAGKVRAILSSGRATGQYIATLVILTFGALLVWFTQWLLPSPLDWFGCVATLLATFAFVYLGTHRDYRWIELDGETIRAKHLYTGASSSARSATSPISSASSRPVFTSKRPWSTRSSAA
jgi:hypothetical protein